MKKEEFIKTLKELMDTDEELTLNTELKEILEWDSVSMVAFFSFCGQRLEESELLMQKIENAATVGDLYNIIGAE
ncbi:MAG: hypothetical protein IJJ91_10660 [Synergistaceae bacterium]|nr:hypothetical protein [Synergistaceae bacterium]MBR0168650.1 hypothetical protein [Synergistaceae bacterium]MBR0232639.1 hypothetical protein [Synergistaceae bacterium]